MGEGRLSVLLESRSSKTMIYILVFLLIIFMMIPMANAESMKIGVMSNVTGNYGVMGREEMKLIPTIRLIRLEESSQGTFGVLIICSQVFCVTLEPSDWLNEQNISSIPAQQYQCIKIRSPQFGETFEIVDVPGKSHVLFHTGSVVKHTKGCIILAQYWGKLESERAVLNSGKTFKKFMEIMRDVNIFNLTIIECF